MYTNPTKGFLPQDGTDPPDSDVSSAIGYILPIVTKFLDEYGHRAKQAAENKNIDWKAISHVLRAAIQTQEIMLTGTITFPLFIY